MKKPNLERYVVIKSLLKKGLSHREIVKQLGCSFGTIKKTTDWWAWTDQPDFLRWVEIKKEEILSSKRVAVAKKGSKKSTATTRVVQSKLKHDTLELTVEELIYLSKLLTQYSSRGAVAKKKVALEINRKIKSLKFNPVLIVK